MSGAETPRRPGRVSGNIHMHHDEKVRYDGQDRAARQTCGDAR